ncbi:MAG: CapA family protein [Hungatella sp.]|nr:CapA family protein [Hungatella sp.]
MKHTGRYRYMAALTAVMILAGAVFHPATAAAANGPAQPAVGAAQESQREDGQDTAGMQIYEKEPKSQDKITLSFAGDISFAEGYANMAYYHGSGDDITRCIAPEVIARMDAADIMMVNNEFTYSTRGTPLSGKTFTFRAKPETVKNLSVLSADIVSLANNHVYDYGETALLDTMETLRQQGIPYVGAGKNLEEAKEIVYFQVEDQRIAYVSATQVERSYVFTKEATDTSPGVLRTYDPTAFVEVIREAEENSDFVVVYVHWGTEGVNQFEADQQKLGHAYIDAGADLVIGDHPHCLQGVEYYKGVPIFYSLGNFWFNSKTRDTGIVEADISPEGLVEFRFVPCLQSGCRTTLITDEARRQQVFRFLEGISANAVIDENGVIREKK